MLQQQREKDDLRLQESKDQPLWFGLDLQGYQQKLLAFYMLGPGGKYWRHS